MIYLLAWDGLSGKSHYFWEAQFKIMCAQYIWFGLLCTLCGGQVFVYIPGNPLGKYTLILLPLDYWRLVERRPLCGKYQYYEHLTKHYMYWRGLVEHFAKSLFTFWIMLHLDSCSTCNTIHPLFYCLIWLCCFDKFYNEEKNFWLDIVNWNNR